jgi:hypothetical protein
LIRFQHGLVEFKFKDQRFEYPVFLLLNHFQSKRLLVADAPFHSAAMLNITLTIMGPHFYSFVAVVCALLFNHQVARVSATSFLYGTTIAPRVESTSTSMTEEGGVVVLACSSNVQTFKTEVFVDLKVDLTTLTPEEIVYLEGIFMTSYNQLSYQFCDKFFRTVEQVTLSLGQSYDIFPIRRLQEVTTDVNAPAEAASAAANSTSAVAIAPDVGSTVFLVTGQCRNCLPDDSGTFSLFDDVHRNQSHAVVLTSRGVTRRLQGSSPPSDTAKCKCPAQVAPVGPTADEFVKVFTEEIELATLSGNVTSVQETGTRAEEGERVTCGDDVQTFRTSIQLDFDESVNSLTTDEIAALEDSIQDSYNGMSRGKRCVQQCFN